MPARDLYPLPGSRCFEKFCELPPHVASCTGYRGGLRDSRRPVHPERQRLTSNLASMFTKSEKKISTQSSPRCLEHLGLLPCASGKGRPATEGPCPDSWSSASVRPRRSAVERALDCGQAAPARAGTSVHPPSRRLRAQDTGSKGPSSSHILLQPRRRPWLRSLRHEVSQKIAKDSGIIMASAIKTFHPVLPAAQDGPRPLRIEQEQNGPLGPCSQASVSCRTRLPCIPPSSPHPCRGAEQPSKSTP